MIQIGIMSVPRTHQHIVNGGIYRFPIHTYQLFPLSIPGYCFIFRLVNTQIFISVKRPQRISLHHILGIRTVRHTIIIPITLIYRQFQHTVAVAGQIHVERHLKIIHFKYIIQCQHHLPTPVFHTTRIEEFYG